MKTIDDALRWADTFDSPHSKHMGLVMLAAEVRRLRGELDGLTKQRDELLVALKDARELVDSWGAYASNYMQEKYDLLGDLDRLDAAINAVRGGK